VTEEAHAGAALGRHAARLVEQADVVAMCLDFDGTLAPIVDDPDQARPLPGMVDLLGPLAARFAVSHCCPGARPAICSSMPPHRKFGISACTACRRSATGSGSIRCWRRPGPPWSWHGRS
jgi:hypothetical protein